VSRVAYQVLLSVEVQKQRDAITALEINERIKALGASHLMDKVFEQAKALMNASQHESDGDQDLPADELGIFNEVPFPRNQKRTLKISQLLWRKGPSSDEPTKEPKKLMMIKLSLMSRL
jgi:hypothetical protein